MPKQIEILSLYPEDELDLELNGSLSLEFVALFLLFQFPSLP